MIRQARSVRSRVGFKISARVRQSSVTIQTSLWTNLNFFGQIIIQRYFVFVSTVELRTLFCECVLKKIALTHAHFQYNSRKLVNVVKVRFTMMYSSRKLNNKKVITTARNFWRQIACSFRRTIHFCATSTRKTLKWIFRFFSPDQHWRHKLFFRQFFRPLYEDKDQKTAIFSCKYLGDTCFNWAETP